jgi:hypothetical protein
MSIPLPILHQNHPWGLDLYTPKIQGGRPNWIKWSCTLSINLGLNLPWHMLQIHFIFRTANWLAQDNSFFLTCHIKVFAFLLGIYNHYAFVHKHYYIINLVYG